jgi:hypothetical protein
MKIIALLSAEFRSSLVTPRGPKWRLHSNLGLLCALCFITVLLVLAVWPMKPIGSAFARFRMDLLDFSCHRSTSTQEAAGFQCVVGGHYLVVYSVHCEV